MNPTDEELEAAKTLASIRGSVPNMDEDILKILQQAFKNHITALSSDEGKRIINSYPINIGHKLYGHLYTQASLILQLIHVGKMEWSENNQRVLADTWKQICKERATFLS